MYSAKLILFLSASEKFVLTFIFWCCGNLCRDCRTYSVGEWVVHSSMWPAGHMEPAKGCHLDRRHLNGQTPNKMKLFVFQIVHLLRYRLNRCLDYFKWHIPPMSVWNTAKVYNHPPSSSSPHHSSILNSKLSYFSNPTLHRHLAPFQTDFTDARTALRLFSLFQFFSSFQLSFFLPF